MWYDTFGPGGPLETVKRYVKNPKNAKNRHFRQNRGYIREIQKSANKAKNRDFRPGGNFRNFPPARGAGFSAPRRGPPAGPPEGVPGGVPRMVKNDTMEIPLEGDPRSVGIPRPEEWL